MARTHLIGLNLRSESLGETHDYGNNNFRHIADNYIARAEENLGSADDEEKGNRRNIVKCRLGTSQDQGKKIKRRLTMTHFFVKFIAKYVKLRFLKISSF